MVSHCMRLIHIKDNNQSYPKSADINANSHLKTTHSPTVCRAGLENSHRKDRGAFVPWLFLVSAAKSLQSCPTLCDPIDGSPPGSPVPGILQARTLEWVAISFSIGFASSLLANTTVQKHQFFGAQLSSQSNSHIHT